MPVCVISDEMAIRKDVSFQNTTKEFNGFAEYVTPQADDASEKNLPVAYNVLVFMVAEEDFKIPVAYYFLAGLDAITRAALTKEVVRSVNETGVRTMTLTGDGLLANITVASCLGADFKNGKPYFISPTNPNHKIYIIWDPPHLLKIARGRMKKKKLFHNGNPIKWSLIESLYDLQKNRNFNLANNRSRNTE